MTTRAAIVLFFTIIGAPFMMLHAYGQSSMLGSMKKKDFEWGAGFLTFRGGHYRGSDQTRDWFFPLPYFSYTSEMIEAEPSFFRGTFYKNDWISLKLSVIVGLNVESESNRARRGMPALDYTFEAGPMVIVKLWQSQKKDFSLTFEAPFRMVHATDLTYIEPVGFFSIPYLNLRSRPLKSLANWSFEASVGWMWGSRKYHQFFYGVAPQFETPERATYDARAGHSGYQYTLILNKRYKDFVFVPFYRFDDLHEAVFEDSPLVKKKSYHVGGLAFFWLFG